MVQTTIANIRVDFSDPLEQVMFLFDYSSAVHMAPSHRAAQSVIVEVYLLSRTLHALKNGSEVDAARAYSSAQRRIMELGYGAGGFYDSGLFSTLLKLGNGHLSASQIKQRMLQDAFNPLLSNFGDMKSARERQMQRVFEEAKGTFEMVLLIASLAVGIGELAGALVVVSSAAIYIIGVVGVALVRLQARITQWANSTRVLHAVPPHMRPNIKVATSLDDLPDDAIVVRGGVNSQDRYANGSGVTANESGQLSNLSVNSREGLTAQELSAQLKNGKISVTTVGDIRKAGGVVQRDGNDGNPNHCLVGGLTAEQLCAIFTEIPNPSKK
jgi:hypothetical protein